MDHWEAGQPRQWRWSSLVQVLKALLKREEALRTGWSKEAYGDTGTTQTIDTAVTSELFWKYSHFLHIVAGMVDVQSSYCEGCSCHEGEGLKHNGYHVRAREISLRLRTAINEGDPTPLPYPATCPLKNRRAPEIASGMFERFLQDTMTVTKEKLLDFRGTLPDSDWQIILGDWLSARESCQCLHSFQFRWFRWSFSWDQLRFRLAY